MEADHGAHEVRLDQGAGALAGAFLSRLTATNVPSLHCGTDRTGRAEEYQPMVQWLVPGEDDQLHYFVTAGVWDAAPLEAELLVQADRLVASDNSD